MSDSSEQKSSVSSELQALIQRYQQLSALGKPVDFDALCAEAPHLKQELQSLIDQQAIPGPTEETAADNRAEATLHRAPGTVDTTPSLHSGLETIQPGSDEAADVKPQEEMFGRYKLEKLLGEGAMGSVYLAADTSLERQVALKIPKFSDHQQQELMTRFLREARSAAAVNHPNICKILDIGDVDGKPFLTMDFIDGETLSSHVGSEALRDEQKIVQLVLTLAHALDDAHSQGIIHRDLKPGNVMLNSKGTPFITDFGLARKVEQSDESRLTQEGTILGTPAYMSPEQIEGNPDKIGPQSDLYSLGVIFYELLTGELPFSGTIPMMLGQILRDVPSPPSQLRQGLDKQLDTICLKMMEKSTEKRYASCAEVAKVLQSWIEKQSAALRAQPAAAPKAKQPASKKLQAHKQQIEQMLKKRQISQAVQALEKLTQLQAKGAEKYVEWAKAELKKTKKLAKQYHENLSATIASAGKLLSKHDYAATIKLLQQVPMEFRNDQATELLEEAIDLQDEVTWLSEDIRESLKKQNLKGIESNLNRLLEIKPGNKMARELHESLNSYGSGKKHKFDDKGKLIPSTAGFDAFNGVRIAAAVGGIAFMLMLAAVTIYLKSSGKTIEVTLDDPTAEVFIGDNHVEIKDGKGTITLDVKEYAVVVKRGDIVVESGYPTTYTVQKGKNLPLVIKLRDVTDSVANGNTSTTTGWTNLFNGKDLTGWKLYNGGPLANSGWKGENREIQSSDKRGSDLITTKTYGDFELEFDWKISKGGNSGVIYRVRPGDAEAHLSGLEYQLLDDANHPNGKSPKTSAASLYGMFAPQNKSVKPIGEWNSAKIIAYGNHLEHWLNGSKILETDIDSPAWKQAFSTFKFTKRNPQFGKTMNGHIALQAYGSPTWFRNIRIRELDRSGKLLTSNSTNEYDSIATGKWVDVYKAHPPKSVGDKAKFKDGVLELNDSRYSFPQFSGRNIMMRAKMKHSPGSITSISFCCSVQSGVNQSYTGSVHYSDKEQVKFVLTKTTAQNFDELLKVIDKDASSIVSDSNGYFEITFASRGNQLSLFVNGKKYLESTDSQLTEGIVRLNSQLGVSSFKDVQVMLLDDMLSTANTDRQVAEWVLGTGGRVKVLDGAVEIKEVDQLPDEAFDLSSIWLSGREVKDQELEILKGLKQLRRLNMNGSGITDVGLKYVKELKSLQVISLIHTKVTGTGLVNLKGLTDLKTIELAGSAQFSDTGLEHITELTNLLNINCDSTNITDAGLKHLKKLTQLKQLHLKGTKVTAAGVAELKKALPDCEIK